MFWCQFEKPPRTDKNGSENTTEPIIKGLRVSLDDGYLCGQIPLLAITVGHLISDIGITDI